MGAPSPGGPTRIASPGENVLQDRDVVLQRARELHSELRQRSACHHGDVAEDSRRDERCGNDDRVDRPRAERLDVCAGRIRAPGLLRDCLPEVSAAPLVAIADGLLTAAERIVDLFGREAGLAQEVLEGQSPGRLAGEILEEHAGREALVELVGAKHRAGEPAAQRERQSAVSRLLAVQPKELERVRFGHASVELLLVDDHAVWALPGSGSTG